MDDDSGATPGALKPLRCLIVVPSLTRAGAETQVVELANGLVRNGHAVHLCTFEKQLDLQDRLSDAVRFHHLRRKGKLGWSVINALADVIDREHIQVVQGVLQFATFIAWMAARRSSERPPVIAAVHTTINRDIKHEMFDRLLYRRIFRRLPVIIFVCEHQRKHWIRKYPELEKKSIVIYNGVSLETFDQKAFEGRGRETRVALGIAESTFVFLCIAGFRPEKGHHILINALAKLTGDVCIVFAGDGELRKEMERRVAASQLSDRTRFVGNVSDIRPLIAASNVTVLASTAVETFSMAMLESMAMGVPMVAPRIGGLPEAIIDGQTGMLFPIGDQRALTNRMQALVDDPDKAGGMGCAAQVLVADRFGLDDMVACNERILVEIASKAALERQ